MSVLSTEALFAIMMAAECAVRGDFIASLKSKMSEAQYLELMLNMKHHPDEFIKAREEAEVRFAKNSQQNAFLNLVRLSNSEDEKVSLRASLGILRMDLSKKRQKLEQRKLKLRERIEDREQRLALEKANRESLKEVVDTSQDRQKMIREKNLEQEAKFAEFLQQLDSSPKKTSASEELAVPLKQSIAMGPPDILQIRDHLSDRPHTLSRQREAPPLAGFA